MKRMLAGMLAASAMTVVLALGGCGHQGSSATDATPVREQSTSATGGDSGEASTDGSSETDAGTTDGAGGAHGSTTTTDGGATASARIGEDEARRIALEDAGAAEQDATQLSVRLDTDDAAAAYEVDFRVGTTEYDYDIDAVTGAVLERNAEIDD